MCAWREWGGGAHGCIEIILSIHFLARITASSLKFYATMEKNCENTVLCKSNGHLLRKAPLCC